MQQNLKEELENILWKLAQEMAAEGRKEPLKFVSAGEGVHRVYNVRTGRFHDTNLGIDMLIAEEQYSVRGKK